jgi:predicted transcriptional regulator
MENRVFFAEPADIPEIARALDSELRRSILELLGSKKLNVNQIAEALGIPQSTCTVNVQLLEKAKLIKTEQLAASTKGSQKLCSLAFEEVVLPLKAVSKVENDRLIATEMPIGLYTDFHALPPCGLLSDTGIIGYFDQVESFLNPKRASAGLLWISKGWVEYRFPKEYLADSTRISGVSVSAEICSEFPGYKNTWPSDITLWINGVELGTWTSPGDMGGEYGRLTPRWWDLKNTQYGFLKTWRITKEGSFIDGVKAGEAVLADIGIEACEYFLVRIGIKDETEYPGGFNLFGRSFGNYEQDLVFRMELEG